MISSRIRPVLVNLNTSPEESAEQRLRNITTKERGHLKEETMSKALSMVEVPSSEEQPITYNTSLDLDEWVKKNITQSIST